MKRSPVVDYLVYLIVRILICVVQATRLETGQRLGRQLAWWFSDVLGIRRNVVDENLRHAFPAATEADRRRLARRMWEHLFLLVIEVAHAPRKIHESNWRRYARLENVAPLVQTLIDDRPTMIVTGHFGNFELGGFLLGLLGFPSFTVARTLDNRYVDRFVNEFRGATGQYIISKNDGFDQIQAVMARGGTMTFLADQYAGAKGCWVEFFGRPASAHKAIALLAVEHDAAVTVCYCRRLGSPMQFELAFGGKADPRQAVSGVGSIRDLTQWYTARLEEAIRRTPDQYWWLHRRWKDPRPARRKPAGKAA